MIHGEYGSGYRVTYWKDNAASDSINANRVRIQVGLPGMPYPEWEFNWPEQRFEVEKMVTAFQKIHTRGVYDAKREIRSVLGL